MIFVLMSELFQLCLIYFVHFVYLFQKSRISVNFITAGLNLFFSDQTASKWDRAMMSTITFLKVSKTLKGWLFF
jgi:hypothetical protein